MKIRLKILLGLTVLLSSCGILIFRKVTCRKYVLHQELYWYQGTTTKSFSLINEQTKAEKVFYVNDRWISNRESYYSDSGCDCHDMSSELLISNQDSIWTIADSRYVERNSPKYKEAVVFVFDNKKWVFNDDLSEIKESIETYDGVEIETKTFTEEYQGVAYKLVLGKQIGVISVQFGKDNIWNRKTLTKEPVFPSEFYRTMTNYCN